MLRKISESKRDKLTKTGENYLMINVIVYSHLMFGKLNKVYGGRDISLYGGKQKAYNIQL